VATDVRREADESVRDRLMTAAVELFASKGYAATSVREIVESAGVTKPALYYYFKSKDGIFLEIMGEALRAFEETIGAALEAGGSATERIYRLLDRLFTLILDNLDVVRLAHALYFGPPHDGPVFDMDAFHEGLQAAILGLVNEGMAAGELRESDPEPVALAILGALDTAEGIALCHPEWGLTQETLRRMLDVVFHGALAARDT
jgi:TetR/AcrR family transcriptional regulator